jgi:large subunit ribosomal protein L25
MKQLSMEAKVRTELKKNAMNRLRAEQNIPAVLYGKGSDSVHLEVNSKDLRLLLIQSEGSHAILSLTIRDGNSSRQELAMIKNIQRHPINSSVQHLEFVKVAMDKPIETTVPIVLVGASLGVKAGGILEQVHRELPIYCLPNLIPEHIELDITALNIGDAITVENIRVQDGIEVLIEDPHEPIVHIVAPRMEEKEEKPAAATPEVQQPEVIGEKERLERQKSKDEKA